MSKITLKYPLILGSGSPRRHEIMKAAGFDFEVAVRPTSEAFSPSLNLEEIPVMLALEKLKQFDSLKGKIILCADTIVCVNNRVLNKPSSEKEAVEMLLELGNTQHQVHTGVAMRCNEKLISFHDCTQVYFNKLSDHEVKFYVENWKPLDKAGAYGIQEFLGMVAIHKIEGSFYTVMGLPIHKVYNAIKPFIAQLY